jgi:hypothetical protein
MYRIPFCCFLHDRGMHSFILYERSTAFMYGLFLSELPRSFRHTTLLSPAMAAGFVALVLAACFLLQLFFPKQKRKHSVDGEMLRSLEVQYTSCATKYNQFLSMYDMVYEKKFKEVQSCADFAAMQVLTDNCETFHDACAKLLPLFDEIHALAGRQEFDAAAERLEEADVLLCDLEHAIEAIRTLTPKDTRHASDASHASAGAAHAKEGNAQDAFSHPGRASSGKTDFFSGCASAEAVEKRYKALVKAFHPDNGFGDTQSFQLLQQAYEQKKREVNQS